VNDWLHGTGYSMAVVKRQSHEFVGYVAMHAVGPTRHGLDDRLVSRIRISWTRRSRSRRSPPPEI